MSIYDCVNEDRKRGKNVAEIMMNGITRSDRVIALKKQKQKIIQKYNHDILICK